MSGNGYSGWYTAGVVTRAFDAAGSNGVLPTCPSGGVWFASGTVQTVATFVPQVPSPFSFCAVTRYTGVNRGRVLTALGDDNFILTHDAGSAGVVFYSGIWAIPPPTLVNMVGSSSSWVIVVRLSMLHQASQLTIGRTSAAAPWPLTRTLA